MLETIESIACAIIITYRRAGSSQRAWGFSFLSSSAARAANSEAIDEAPDSWRPPRSIDRASHACIGRTPCVGALVQSLLPAEPGIGATAPRHAVARVRSKATVTTLVP